MQRQCRPQAFAVDLFNDRIGRHQPDTVVLMMGNSARAFAALQLAQPVQPAYYPERSQLMILLAGIAVAAKFRPEFPGNAG